MSLYNMLFGTNPNTKEILAMIGIENTSELPRFRDVDLIENATKIRVFTRTGGGNREIYAEELEKIRKHEFYIRDYDDEFDETYAYIEFKVPEKCLEKAKEIFGGEPISFEQKFKKELEDMEEPNSEAHKRAEEIAQKIENAIDNGETFIGI